ncbi:MAG: hypothetical protein ACK47B_05815 [Armatimonadota bacterium]
MAAVLHVAALLNRSPESAGAHAPEAAARTDELRELADQVERLRAGEITLDAAGRESRIQEVLRELRQDEAARRELSPAAEPEREGLRLGG